MAVMKFWLYSHSTAARIKKPGYGYSTMRPGSQSTEGSRVRFPSGARTWVAGSPPGEATSCWGFTPTSLPLCPPRSLPLSRLSGD